MDIDRIFQAKLCMYYLGQGVQEWTKENVEKTDFREFEVKWSRQTILLQTF